jgi:hypothetical protein
MDRDKMLALCDGIDEELEAIGGHSKIIVNKYTDAIRAKVSKSNWIPVILPLCRKCGKGGGEMTFQHQPIFNLLTVKHRDLFTTIEKYL